MYTIQIVRHGEKHQYQYPTCKYCLLLRYIFLSKEFFLLQLTKDSSIQLQEDETTSIHFFSQNKINIIQRTFTLFCHNDKLDKLATNNSKEVPYHHTVDAIRMNNFNKTIKSFREY